MDIFDLKNNSQLASMSKQFANGVLALRNTLKIGVLPATITLIGDSTGNENHEWFYKLAEWIGTYAPKHTLIQRLWDDTTQCYADQTVLKYGSDGEAYFAMDGTAYCFAPTRVDAPITGDLEVIVKVKMDDYTPAADKILISKFGNPGDRGWALGIKPTGHLFWWWSADGTNLIGGSGSAIISSEALGVADSSDVWIKSTFDVDNGASGHTIKYFKSTDGTNWTQVGTDIVGVGTTSFFANTANYELGSRSGGTGAWSGRIYYAYIKSGIDGKIIASPTAGQAFPDENINMTYYDVEGNQWTVQANINGGTGSSQLTILNGSCPGKAVAYSAGTTRFAIQFAKEPMITFISYSHNEGATTGSYKAAYKAFLEQIKTKWPDTEIICVLQNPRLSPANYIKEHTIRLTYISQLAALKGYMIINAFEAFINTGDYSGYMMADGIHPNTAGYELWLNSAKQTMSILAS